ncbi:glycoside hydrolase family 43 protein [Cellulosimicrobium sp. Marseille-Q4280]|uniref:glycoside hydrolase family 43 protein n=1 Tax=Cellulosimicrobium sp. Marseille-Q4280 TaxID=2937992 RepID=UPI00203BBDD9|nr:glycoside hydrolase family 43 protein [Cellulosimicrobium sp. Marseille-Q4280]
MTQVDAPPASAGEREPDRAAQARFGYLLVHFVEDPYGHEEKIHYSLSRGDDPTAWDRLGAVVESRLGTTGLRDPHVVRSPGGDEFFLVATDLRVFGGDDAGWDAWQRHGSRSLVVARSTDLVQWSEPRLVEVAPPEAGMAWAPEAFWDARSGHYVVHWSSTLYDPADTQHAGESYSRILCATTTDFVTFSPARVLLDTGRTTIDTTMIEHDGRVFRFHKDNSPGGRELYMDVVPHALSDDAVVLAERIGADRFGQVEGPLVFRANDAERWYLFVDQYGEAGQGYRPFVTHDLASGRWAPVDGSFDLPDRTKHGVVLPLYGDEWHRLAEAFPA